MATCGVNYTYQESILPGNVSRNIHILSRVFTPVVIKGISNQLDPSGRLVRAVVKGTNL